MVKARRSHRSNVEKVFFYLWLRFSQSISVLIFPWTGVRNASHGYHLPMFFNKYRDKESLGRISDFM